MNSGFINRLVGTSIVVIAAIVFIPNILDGEKTHYKEGFKAIPERSEFKTIDLQESIDDKVASARPLKQETIEDIEPLDSPVIAENDESQYASEPAIVTAQVEPQNNDSVANEVETPEEKPAVTKKLNVNEVKEDVKVAAKIEKIEPRSSDDNLSDMAYVIQLGSFSHAANVKALQAKLKAKGFTTFTKPIKTPNGTLTKVFVGPSLNKDELQAKLPKLKSLTKLNGKITRFKVTE
ncbi:SPOR domain-containing protein [Pseudoalteromonas sp. MMG010]|uniref:SPOR domain-containing protein n=1 Tax=Pseudoalteromonas sp. MMG010 TaxID=2822685 RepID=UPI001B3A4B0E|nr:SPOR domain-containing protein [Pseudoalteromonas sp. MMG010]